MSVYTQKKNKKNIVQSIVITPANLFVTSNKNIKSAILTDGINTILKKQKKIVINPNELKSLFDKNSKDLRPEKIIDFFLN